MVAAYGGKPIREQSFEHSAALWPTVYKVASNYYTVGIYPVQISQYGLQSGNIPVNISNYSKARQIPLPIFCSQPILDDPILHSIL